MTRNLVPSAFVLADVCDAIGLADIIATHVRVEGFDKNQEAVLFVLHLEPLKYQTEGSPWRFKCTAIYGFAEGTKEGTFYLDDGKVYIDVPGFPMQQYDQVVKVQNALVPVLTGNAKLEAMVRDQDPDLTPVQVSAKVATANMMAALQAVISDDKHAQFYLNKTSGRFDAQLTLTPHSTQMPGRPWAFLVDVQTGWFKIKSGIAYCEDGMVHFNIDGRPPFSIQQRSRVEDTLFA